MDKVIVFGTGNYFRQKGRQILSDDAIEGFIDNKVKPGCEELYNAAGVKIVNPKDIAVYNTGSKIYLMSVRFVDMWMQLETMDVDPDRLVYPFDIGPQFEYEKVLYGKMNSIAFKRDYFECTGTDGTKHAVHDKSEWDEYLRQLFREKYQLISQISNMDTNPISRYFGTERGTPVDRYYIDSFLRKNQQYITGDVLEIEDNKYTKKMGAGNVHKSIVIDVSRKDESIDFNANLETGEGVRDNVADCFILTQTLMYIFDVCAAAKNIGRLLKHGGTALITCSGLSQNSCRCMDNYGAYFNFNKEVFVKMFENMSDMCVIETGSYGNVKTVMAHLSGMCMEDLSEEDFECNDKYYPLIVYAVVKKS